VRRTTVVLDEELLSEAQEALGTRVVRETIEAGLREVVRRKRLEGLRRALGRTELALGLEELLRLRGEG